MSIAYTHGRTCVSEFCMLNFFPCNKSGCHEEVFMNASVYTRFLLLQGDALKIVAHVKKASELFCMTL
jgi:hypothetical protein